LISDESAKASNRGLALYEFARVATIIDEEPTFFAIDKQEVTSGYRHRKAPRRILAEDQKRLRGVSAAKTLIDAD